MNESQNLHSCNLKTYLNLQSVDTSENSRDYSFKLPKVMSEWGEKFNEDYNEEGSDFIDGSGTDQDLTDIQRLYFVNIAVTNIDVEECFPKQINGMFLNKRKNEWMTRFMGYGIIYLLVSGLSTVTSVF